jgi:hypothetical protein
MAYGSIIKSIIACRKNLPVCTPGDFRRGVFRSMPGLKEILLFLICVSEVKCRLENFNVMMRIASTPGFSMWKIRVICKIAVREYKHILALHDKAIGISPEVQESENVVFCADEYSSQDFSSLLHSREDN